MREQETAVNIIGAGLAGLSAARTFAMQGVPVRLVSVQASERAQSNLAEGGINAALDEMGEQDSPDLHFEDTMKGGCFLADPNMVRGLTEAAPGIVRELDALGVPFHREDGHIVQRSFGGQRKKRTAYAKSSTGKVLTAALIDAVRKYEAEGLVTRLSHHRFERLLLEDGELAGVQVYDSYRREETALAGAVVLACGGMNGLFASATTGTTADTGSAAAMLLCQGVRLANLEFLQYHPTTAAITGKRLLVSEAARGEGGRLFCFRDGRERCWFMEEKYGEKGNLMPRDVISREMAMLGHQAYLDLTGLAEETWRWKLPDLREEIIHYLGIDPARVPVPVSPGIHYFMGGILTDEKHRTSLPGLYAAGECACAYHGANRLGGNSLLGAVYGGKIAAQTAMEEQGIVRRAAAPAVPFTAVTAQEQILQDRMTQALCRGLPPLRDEEGISHALGEIRALVPEAHSDEMKARLTLAEAILLCALERRESRGAHTRTDFPDTDEAYRRTTVVSVRDGETRICFEKIPADRKET